MKRGRALSLPKGLTGDAIVVAIEVVRVFARPPLALEETLCLALAVEVRAVAVPEGYGLMGDRDGGDQAHRSG